MGMETTRRRLAGEMSSPGTEAAKVARNAHTVLDIPELLELVLSHVADWPFFQIRNIRSTKDTDSFIDLYHCSLVCKYWKSLIDTSPAIWRKVGMYDNKKPRPPVDYHQIPFSSENPAIILDGDLYPTICYPFISWLARRVPRCFEKGSKYFIQDLHHQYIEDNFPPSYFSNPPTTEISIDFIKMDLIITSETYQLMPNIRPFSAGWKNGHPSQSFAIRNQQGVTVEDIVKTVCTLITPLPKANKFSGLRIGIFKRTQQERRGKELRWSLVTRYGSFDTEKDVGENRTYRICDEFVLYEEMYRSCWSR